VDLGYNYRITDFQCALGITQLQKLPRWIERRREIAKHYNEAFAHLKGIKPLAVKPGTDHAYHLYVVRVNNNETEMNRSTIFKTLRSRGIGVNVHYIPVHLHPFYKKQFATSSGLCPAAEEAYEQILSLPMFPSLSDGDVKYVIETIENVISNPGQIG